MTSYLHTKVHFITPFVELHGQEAIILAAKDLSQVLEEIHIQSRFLHDNQIMLVYDFIFCTIGKLRAAVFMEFTDSLISKIELFYDGRPFAEKIVS